MKATEGQAKAAYLTARAGGGQYQAIKGEDPWAVRLDAEKAYWLAIAQAVLDAGEPKPAQQLRLDGPPELQKAPKSIVRCCKTCKWAEWRKSSLTPTGRVGEYSDGLCGHRITLPVTSDVNGIRVLYGRVRPHSGATCRCWEAKSK